MTTFYSRLYGCIKDLSTAFSIVVFFWCTAGLGQTTFTNNTPVTIEDFEQADSSINSTLSGIYGVDYIITNLTLNINHDFAEDMVINLISPDGTLLVLSHHNGGGFDAYGNTQFEFGGDDITVATPPFNGIYEPQGGAFIDAFRNENVEGEWILSIFDSWEIIEGTLNSFSITFDTAPSCLWPTNVSAAPLNATSANVYWANTNEAINGYDWVLMAEGDDPEIDTPIASDTNVFSNTASVFGLTAGTTYDFYVKSNCDSTNSVWSSRERFTVSQDYCGANNFYDNGGPAGNYANNSFEVTTISPLVSGNKVSAEFTSFATELHFDGLLIFDGPNTSAPLISSDYESPNTGSVPDGAWTGTGDFSANGVTFTSTHPTGTLTFFFISNPITTMAGWEAIIDCGDTPPCIIPENFLVSNVSFTTADLNWNATLSGETGGYEYLIVSGGSLPDGSTPPIGSVASGETTVTVTGLQQTTTYDAYVRAVCSPDPAGERSEWTAAQTFTTLTSCAPPQNLTATTIGPFDVDLEWSETSSGETEGYEYVVYDDGTVPDGSTEGTPVGTGITTVNVDGLSPETDYTAYIRAICETDDVSAWSSALSFTTPMSCIAPENLTVSNVQATSADLTWEATQSVIFDGGYQWVLMESGEDPDVETPLFSGTTDESTITASTTGLDPSTTYDAYVRAQCNTEDFSQWSNVASFTTFCLPETPPWYEGFEDMATVGTASFPDCWSSSGSFASNNVEAFGGIEAYQGDTYIANFNGTNIVYTPGFNLLDTENYTFSFWYVASNDTSTSQFNVYVGTSPDIGDMDSIGGISPVQNTEYEQFSVEYTPPTTGVYYFAVEANSMFVGLGFDEFSLERTVEYTFSEVGGFEPFSPNGVSESFSTLTVEDGTATLDNVTVLNNIIVRPGAVLDINEDLMADMVFESDATGFGQLANTNGHTINGTARVENFIPQKRAFRSVSSPVSEVSVADSWQQQIHITGAPGPVGGTSPDGFDYTATGNPSMFSFNHGQEDQNTPSPWIPIPNTNVYELEAGYPYFVMIRGHRDDVDLNSNNSPATDVTLNAEGSLHTGTFDAITSPFPENYSLVGNPYQAIVNLNNLTYGDGVNSTYAYYWDASVGALGQYISVTLSDGSADPSNSNADHFLRPGQAVFIRNNDTGTDYSIQFTEDAIDTSGSQTMVFSAPSFKYLNLRVYTQERFLTNQTEEDALSIRFASNFNNATNSFDAIKMYNPGVNFSRIDAEENLLSIERRDLPIHQESLALYIDNLESTNYVIEVQAESFEASQLVYLIDHYTDIAHQVEQGINHIEFNADVSVPESMQTSRFQLWFENESLGTSQESLSNQITLYPNPVEDILFIKNSSGNDLKVSIYTAQGQKVSEVALSSFEDKRLSFEAFSSGLYILKLSEMDRVYYKKIIKK